MNFFNTKIATLKVQRSEHTFRKTLILTFEVSTMHKLLILYNGYIFQFLEPFMCLDLSLYGGRKMSRTNVDKKNIEYHVFLFWKFCKNDVHVSMYQKVQSDFFYLH